MNTILFVLPVAGGSGGAHSVMQEAQAMRALGMNALIAVNQDNAAKLRKAYRDLSLISSNVHGYSGPEGLGSLIGEHNPIVTVATTNQSVHMLAEAISVSKLKGIRTAYYVQDYEPLFYDKSSADWMTAYRSYGLIPGMIHFAKTRWLQEVVEANHRVKVAKVVPSVDHGIFYPQLMSRQNASGSITVAAMLRPGTPRRASRRTARIMSRIAHEFAGRADCVTFGCEHSELRQHALRLADVKHLGVLVRGDVAELFREVDLFLDLSDYQAFGRTAIEAMSCGAVAVVPAHGGAYEFAVDGKNAFVVDTRSDDAIFAAVSQFASMSSSERWDMALSAIASAYEYSPEKAAISMVRLLSLSGFQ